MANNDFPVDIARTFMAPRENTPKIGFLGGEYGKEIDQAIQKDYKDFEGLNQASYFEKDHRIWNASNPFYTVAVQDRLPEGVRVATQSDLERALKIDALNLSDVFVTTSLVLRSEGDPNSYLANKLMNQIKKKEGSKLELPIMIPLYGLSLVKDNNSPWGVSFNLKETAELIHVPILNKLSQNWLNYHCGKEVRGINPYTLFHSPGTFMFDSEDVNTETGLPTEVSDSLNHKERMERILENGRNLSGLCSLVMNEKLILSWCESFDFSPGIGRVVLVSPGKQE